MPVRTKEGVVYGYIAEIYFKNGADEIQLFKDKHDNNYVETHHIIEYNKTEQGPDVLQNLLVLWPNCHSKIHFSNLDTVHSFFNQLREKKAITLDQFKEIHTNFKMLKLSHIKILCNKNIISKNEEIELIKFIND